MQLVKLITLKRINALRCFFLIFPVLVFTAFSPVFSQDNSPYSRYGIGDLVPSTNIINRSMGGVTAAYSDIYSINFNNPASFSSLQGISELKSKKLSAGRAVLDVGINFESRSLKEPATSKTFVASNALFSYVYVGVPLKSNWGLSFGLRPVSRISYKQFRSERLVDPLTGLPIDSAITRFEGNGGSYLASIGTGFSLFQRMKNGRKGEDSAKLIGQEKLSFGITGGYMFGKKDYSTRRTLVNDSVQYNQGNYQTKTNFGGLSVNLGLQYKLPLTRLMMLHLGAYGNLGNELNATQDVLRETFVFDPSAGDVRQDSVSDLKNVKGKLKLPSSYTFGFLLQKLAVINKEGGWMFGIDFMTQKWEDYRFYDQSDMLRNKWELRVGGSLNPTPKRNYFSNVTYRFGFFTGPDYVEVGNKLPQYGGTFGIGLPFASSRTAQNQVTLLNLAFEYIKRGNNDNVLRENMFRISLGLSLSDYWFIKRKYD